MRAFFDSLNLTLFNVDIKGLEVNVLKLGYGKTKLKTCNLAQIWNRGSFDKISILTLTLPRICWRQDFFRLE